MIGSINMVNYKTNRFVVTEAKLSKVFLPEDPELYSQICFINKSSDEIRIQAPWPAIISGPVVTKPGGKITSKSPSATIALLYVGKSYTGEDHYHTWIVTSMIGDWDFEVDSRAETENIYL